MDVDVPTGFTLPRASRVARGSRLIVAADDPAVRSTAADVLRMDGHRVGEAIDGEHLLKYVIHAFAPRAGAVAAIDLIVSEMWMPFLNGLDVLAMLRADQRATPVLLMTSDADPSLRRRVHELGGVLVEKPFSFDALRAAVRRTLGHAGKR